MKTIGFMISDQHLIPHGGIGQFCRSFVKMMREHGHKVVLITDKKPKQEFTSEVNADWEFYPRTPLSYATHRELYGRFQEGVCYEKIINFTTALSIADNFVDLDVIVANSHESLASLADYKINAKKVLYTHLYKQIYPDVKYKNIFLPAYHTFFQQFLYRPDIIVGTQSAHNAQRLMDQGIDGKNIDVLPMPISETSLLESSDHLGKIGALFIGRWEGGKNPDDYLKLVKRFDLYPKVLTNSTGARKFYKAFSELGIKDYDIREEIIGQEKVDFIKSCKLFLNTSLIECFPNSVMETIGHMDVITLDKVKVPWPDNFDGKLHQINVNDKSGLIQDIIDDRENDNTTGLEWIQQYHDQAYHAWKVFVER